MDLDFDGTKVSVDIEQESDFVSKHTGNKLMRVTAKVTATDEEAHQGLLEMIRKGKQDGIRSINNKDETLAKWRIGNSSHKHTMGRPSHRHSFELEELEELKIDSLILGELSFKPYYYNEEFHIDDSLTVRARVSLTEDEHIKLREMFKKDRYFSVTRVGISGEPREMRFGLPKWSDNEDGIKYEVLLFDKKQDSTKIEHGFFEPQMQNIKDKLAEHVGIVDNLLTTLTGEGILAEAVIDDIRAKAAEEFFDRKLDFYRVNNLDEWEP